MVKYSPAKLFLVILFLSCLSTLPVTWGYYASDLSKYEDALKDNIKLYPPSDLEIKQWMINERFQQIEKLKKEISMAQTEISIIKTSKSVDEIYDEIFSLKNDGEEMDDGLTPINEYPSGHNPPKEEMIDKIAEIKAKTNTLVKVNIGVCFMISSIAGVLKYWRDRNTGNPIDSNTNFLDTIDFKTFQVHIIGILCEWEKDVGPKAEVIQRLSDSHTLGPFLVNPSKETAINVLEIAPELKPVFLYFKNTKKALS